MKCYKCNSQLDNSSDYCLKCGADVSVYRIVVRTSNTYYNQGLEKAKVRELVAEGVKEFQIIAQELTYYGVDIDGKHHITELISEMADIPGVKWIHSLSGSRGR